MRRRFILAGLLAAVLGVVAAIAQPPAVVIPPADPGAPAPPSAGPTTPVDKLPTASTDAPLSQFEPLIAQPHQTQSAVRAVLLGASWMTRMNQAQGRFMYGYNPALRQELPGDHELHQASAALALGRCAKFTGDGRQAAIASQSVLALIAATKLDPTDANCRIPLPLTPTCNRVGFAALLALAIYELPSHDPKLVLEAERLCGYLRKQCRSEGSVHYAEGPNDDSPQIDPAGRHEYPVMALRAIVVSNRIQPSAWKLEVANKGLAYYQTKFNSSPHPVLASTLSQVYGELYNQTKSNDAAASLFQLNNWLSGLQVATTDSRIPQWAGGFRSIVDGKHSDDPPGSEVGLFIQSLALAYHVNRHVPDLARNERYKSTLLEAARFACSLQYLEANTRHFDNTFRAHMLIGGFHNSPIDGNLRIDATANAVTGLLSFLTSGAANH